MDLLVVVVGAAIILIATTKVVMVVVAEAKVVHVAVPLLPKGFITIWMRHPSPRLRQHREFMMVSALELVVTQKNSLIFFEAFVVGSFIPITSIIMEKARIPLLASSAKDHFTLFHGGPNS